MCFHTSTLDKESNLCQEHLGWGNKIKVQLQVHKIY